MPNKLDLSIVSKDDPFVDWTKFTAADFPGIPEVLIGELASDLHPNSIAVRYLAYCLERTDSHASYQLGVGLSLLATCVPQHLTYDADELKSNMYVCIVGPSRDAHKSHAIKLGLQVIDQIESVVPSLKGRMRALPEQGSVEKLVDEIIENPQVLLWLQELGTMLSESANTRHMKPLRERLCSLADCFPVQRATVSKRGATPIQRDPRLSVVAAGTADHFIRYTQFSDWTTGFLARFLFLYANPERRWDSGTAGDPEKLRDLNVDLTAMAELRGLSRCSFSEPAMALWKKWKATLHTLEINSVAEPCVKAAEILAKKCAMLWGFDRLFTEAKERGRTLEPGDYACWEVSEADLKAGMKLANLHIMSVLYITNNVADSIDAALMRQILGYCNPITPTTTAHILRKMELRGTTMVQLIATLISRGELSRCTQAGPEAYYRVIVREAADGTPLDATGQPVPGPPSVTLPSVTSPSITLSPVRAPSPSPHTALVDLISVDEVPVPAQDPPASPEFSLGEEP